MLTLFVNNEPKPGELLRLLVTRPRTTAAIIGFATRGVVPATKAAHRGDYEASIRIFGRAALGREAFDALSRERIQQVQDNFIPAELLGSGFALIDQERLRRTQIPTLLITGDRSPALFHRLCDRLEELLPMVQRVEVAGASHIVHEDNTGAFNEAVLKFLGRA